MGNLRFAYILNALRDWIGDEAEDPRDSTASSAPSTRRTTC